jgi:hypothetical protein
VHGRRKIRMLKNHMILIGVIGLSIMFLGCAGNLPQAERTEVLNMNWGKSFESAKHNQILNPEAGKEPTPVVGFDGKAAAANVEKYREMLKREEKVTQTVGVGLQVRPLK